jgi:hypothetical protein
MLSFYLIDNKVLRNVVRIFKAQFTIIFKIKSRENESHTYIA